MSEHCLYDWRCVKRDLKNGVDGKHSSQPAQLNQGYGNTAHNLSHSGHVRNISLLAWGQASKGSAKKIQELVDDNFGIFFLFFS